MSVGASPSQNARKVDSDINVQCSVCSAQRATQNAHCMCVAATLSDADKDSAASTSVAYGFTTIVESTE